MISQSELENVRLDELRRQLNEDLRREKGRFVHTVCDKNPALFRMELQNLLPTLEKQWHTLSTFNPDQPAWRKAQGWLIATKAADLLDEQCREARVGSPRWFLPA